MQMFYGTIDGNKSTCIFKTLSPALFGDDHLCLVPVELEPQRPVAQIHLSSSHGTDPGPLIRAVGVSRSVSELISRAELPASRTQRRAETRGRDHGAVVQRRVPRSIGTGVYSSGLARVREQRTRTRTFLRLLRGAHHEVSIGPEPVEYVPAAHQFIFTNDR